VPQTSTLTRPAVARFDALADQRRDDVRGARVEVVARAVEVDRQQVDAAQPVLRAVGLELDEERQLGEAVRGVGLLRVAAEELGLAEGHRRELRVGADRADHHDLADAGAPPLLDELRAHHQVLVEEAPRVLAIGADAADDRREVEDQRRAELGVEAGDRGVVDEVVVGAAEREELGRTERAQALDEVASRGTRSRR
jgi:hypothetical protein